MDVPAVTIYPKKYQNEDCLFLNVWAPFSQDHPQDNVAELLPVIVWHYGSAFVEGGGTVP